MPAKRMVALLIGTSPTYVRELAQGVAQYNGEHGRWVICFERCGPDDPPPQWLKGWKGDGILVRVGTWRMARAVLSTGLPAVELHWAVRTPGIPSIGPDNALAARLVAEHLRERGFRQFAMCGLARGVQPPLDDRGEAFVRHLEACGLPCEVFDARRHGTWEREQARIGRWIRSLPKPLGVLACNDECGLQVLNACGRVGLQVPDEVAVVSIGNDDLLCSLAHPPLSSIDLAPRSIGYEAARLLDRLMDGRPVPTEPLLVPPRAVVTRMSSDVLATDDRAVAGAAAFIRARACEGIQIGDVLRQVKLSRWVLEPRMKRVLGRTIHQEIQRVQIERVRELLATTDLPIKQIAAQSGFHYVQYLTRAFHKATGETPGRYRKLMRRLGAVKQ